MSRVTADHYFPEFFAIRGWKTAGMGEDWTDHIRSPFSVMCLRTLGFDRSSDFYKTGLIFQINSFSNKSQTSKCSH